MTDLLLQEKYDALPDTVDHGTTVKDGSSLTAADLPWLLSNGFVRWSRKFGVATTPASDPYKADRWIQGVPLRVLMKLPHGAHRR